MNGMYLKKKIHSYRTNVRFLMRIRTGVIVLICTYYIRIKIYLFLNLYIL